MPAVAAVGQIVAVAVRAVLAELAAAVQVQQA
jgi:hypothetical protein